MFRYVNTCAVNFGYFFLNRDLSRNFTKLILNWYRETVDLTDYNTKYRDLHSKFIN